MGKSPIISVKNKDNMANLHLGTCSKTQKKVSFYEAEQHLQQLASNEGKSNAFIVRITSSEIDPLSWVFLNVPFTSPIEEIDLLLRKIWLEGSEENQNPISYFIIDPKNYFSVDLFDGKDDFTMKIPAKDVFALGQNFKHYYDQESSILNVKVVGEHHSEDLDRVSILLKNDEPVIPCNKCAAQATHVRTIDRVCLCSKCLDNDVSEELFAMSGCKTTAEKAALVEMMDEQTEEEEVEDFDLEDDDFFDYFGVEDEPEYLPLFDSPRSGIKGYLGPKQ